jgi:hypothetical protein
MAYRVADGDLSISVYNIGGVRRKMVKRGKRTIGEG